MQFELEAKSIPHFPQAKCLFLSTRNNWVSFIRCKQQKKDLCFKQLKMSRLLFSAIVLIRVVSLYHSTTNRVTIFSSPKATHTR